VTDNENSDDTRPPAPPPPGQNKRTGPPPAAPPPPKRLPPTEFGTPWKAVATYNAAGISAIPTPGTKGPRLKGWGRWRDQPLEECEQQEVMLDYSKHGEELGVALILGGCAHFVVFDFDQAGAYEKWLERLPDDVRTYIESEVPIVRTPKGYIGHVYLPVAATDLNPGGWFRDTVVEETREYVLARYVTIGGDGEEDAPVSIELRAPYKHAVMAPGSGFGVHDKHPRRTWEYVNPDGKRIEDLASLKPVDGPAFAEMVEAAVALDDPRAKEVLRKKRELQVEQHHAAKSASDLPDAPRRVIEHALTQASGHPEGDRPGDDFNARGTWEEVLEPAGWSKQGDSLWRRPGGSSVSASSKFGPLYVFSTNALPLEASDNGRRAYSKFAAFSALYHADDYKAAAKALRDAGYGKKRRKRGNKPKSEAEREEEKKEVEKRLKDAATKGGRAFICLDPGELPRNLDRAEEALLAREQRKGRECLLFCKGSALVQRIARADGAVATTLVKVHALREHTGRAALFAKLNNYEILDVVRHVIPDSCATQSWTSQAKLTGRLTLAGPPAQSC